jgi:hypothetical protein
MPRGFVEHRGGLFAGPVRSESEMPGAFLDVLRGRRQPLVRVLALGQSHLAVEDRAQQGMGETQHLAIALEQAGVHGLVDGGPRLPVVTGRPDQSFARVAGCSD